MNYWLVGAQIDDKDLSDEFIEQGYWEFAGNDQHNYLDQMQVGEKIAIKSTYTKKNNLPFDANNKSVSTMAIKARGTITARLEKENVFKVEWEKLNPVKEWFFYTSRSAIWRVDPKERWLGTALVNFVFNDKPQEYKRFLTQPFWAERFNKQFSESKFYWTKFYTEFAKKLLNYASDRKLLIKKIHQVLAGVGLNNALTDQNKSGDKFPLEDICPFTVFAFFNRGIKDETRIKIAEELASFLEVETPVPTDFSGIPVANNQTTWFFAYYKDRKPSDIDDLWSVLKSAINYSQTDELQDFKKLKAIFNKTSTNFGIKWNLTFGLYWVLPWLYLPLDSRTRNYLEQVIKINIPYSPGKNPPTADNYFNLIEELYSYFMEDGALAKSFPELSLKAWFHEGSGVDEFDELKDKVMSTPVATNKILYGPPGTGKTYHLTELQQKYTVTESQVTEEQWLQEEVKPLTWFEVIFMTMKDLGGRVRANEILAHKLFKAKLATTSIQNPRSVAWGNLQAHTVMTSETVGYKSRVAPFVFDKTEDSVWYLTGDWQEEMADQIELLNKLNQGKPAQVKQQHFKMLTFHQSYGYEDFIEGLRPITNEEGQISYEVEDGVFKEICLDAKNNPQVKYAIFIDEINRGNISKIFGELITLIEPDKRTVYSESGKLLSGLEVVLPLSKEKFGVPKNLDIYGTMNTADRSISLLDTALRRRFEFAEMMPQVGVVKGSDDEGNIPSESGEINLRAMLEKINQRIAFLLNRDLTLGHSYLLEVKTFEDLQKVFLTKFIPLLQEYFYNDWKQIQLIFNDLDTYGNAQPEQIIQGKLIRADDIFNGLIDGLDEKYEYQVNANFTPEAVIKIYRNNG